LTRLLKNCNNFKKSITEAIKILKSKLKKSPDGSYAFCFTYKANQKTAQLLQEIKEYGLT